MSTASVSSHLNPLLAESLRPLPTRVAVIGAGTIGPDIAYYLKSAIADLTLYLVDVEQEPLDRAMDRIAAYAQKGLRRGKLTEDQAAGVMRQLVPTLDYAAIAECDWALEAATENLKLKRRIFAQLEEVLRPDALITSNTSSLPASRLFSALSHPERATVTHFFAPAFQNPAVEVVRWEQGDPEVLEYLRWLFAMTGKLPLVTSDAPCFMLDRVFDNWCNEAAYLLDRATARQVDFVAGDYVHAGPFRVLNLAHGNPIIVEANTIQMEEGKHYQPARIFHSVATWDTGERNADMEIELETAQDIRDRLLGVLFSQSFVIVDRDIGSASDLNLGCQVALGFRKGPFDLMSDLGAQEVDRILARFTAERPGMPTPQRSVDSYQNFRRHVLVDDIDGVKVITLRRPHAMNALDDDLMDEILAVLEEYENDSGVDGFVIVGDGTRAFCAGADIDRLADVLGREDSATQYARDCSRLLVHLDAMTKPVVAALNGMALGGGLELAMRCHAIIARREAWVQFPEVTLGIAPGIGGMVVPYRKWPGAAPVLHEMLCLAKKLSATDAFELGIVDGLVDGVPQLITQAVDRVKQFDGEVTSIPDGPTKIGPFDPVDPTNSKRPLSRQVVGIIQQAITAAAAESDLTLSLEIGYRAFGASACTAAATEGVSAFLERRKPDFTKTG